MLLRLKQQRSAIPRFKVVTTSCTVFTLLCFCQFNLAITTCHNFATIALKVFIQSSGSSVFPQTSLIHVDVTSVVHSPSEASLISVCVAAPPSATHTQLLDCSDDDNVTESHEGGAGTEGKGGRERGGNYKGWLGTNLPAIQFSTQPVAGATISTESSAAHTVEDEGVKEEVVTEVNSRNMYLQPPTMGTCKKEEEEQQEEEKEPSSILPEVNLLTLTFGTQYNPKEKEEKEEQEAEEEEEVKHPSVPLEVNLLTLTFGTQHNTKEKGEEEESHLLSELTEGAEQWTQEGEEEEEEEQDPDYIGRPYFSRQN